MTGAFGCWHSGSETMPSSGFMHCPITGEMIRGTRAQMRQYAKDMTFLGWHVRPKGKVTAGFSARRIGV